MKGAARQHLLHMLRNSILLLVIIALIKRSISKDKEMSEVKEIDIRTVTGKKTVSVFTKTS